MAADLHDPNNHVPAVSAADVWDDGGLASPARESGARVLPDRQVAAVHGIANAMPRPPEAGGLRIDASPPARRAVPAEGRMAIKEYGGGVVKLPQAPDEGPFQAANVIPAMTLTVRDDPQHLHGEGPDWGRNRHYPLRWLMAAGAGAALLLMAALAAQELLLSQKKKPAAPAIALTEDVKVEQINGFELDGPCEGSARAMVAAYAKATTAAELVPLIRDAARLTPRLTQDWQPWHAPADWQPPREATWMVTAESRRGFAYLSGRKPDFSPFRVYFVRSGKALQIDWEATQGLGDATFPTLERGAGSGGVIRAFLTPENFYSQKFPESGYRSYKVLAPDRAHVIWGYAQANSATAAALLQAFEAAARDNETAAQLPMTLRLTPAPAGAQKNQWLIGELLHIDWVSP
jgi:hypothetical protein